MSDVEQEEMRIPGGGKAYEDLTDADKKVWAAAEKLQRDYAKLSTLVLNDGTDKKRSLLELGANNMYEAVFNLKRALLQKDLRG